MPYVDQEARDRLNGGAMPTTAGELNYALTRLVLAYVYRTGLCYHTINEVVGAIECAKLELYRRLAVPYEETRRDLNGDVYGHAD